MPYGFRQVHGSEGLNSISGVVSSLPVGFTLGEERWDNGLVYRLVYNAGNSQISAGYVANPVTVGAGAYSVSVSSASGTWCNYGAVVCHNATATTGTYFWGAFRGYLSSGLVMDATTMAVGKPIFVGANGTVNGGAAIASGYVSGNISIGLCTTAPAAGTAGVRQGSCLLAIV